MRFWNWVKSLFQGPGVIVVRTGCLDEDEKIGFASDFARSWSRMQEGAAREQEEARKHRVRRVRRRS
jgi:hypothetical protein